MSCIFKSAKLEEAYSYILIDIYAYCIQQLLFNHDHGVFPDYVPSIIERNCYGCMHQCGSQKHHNLCILPFQHQAEDLFHAALAEINEERISETFRETVSGRDLPFVHSDCKYKFFLDVSWRKYVFIQRNENYILEKVIYNEHIERNPPTLKDLNRRG